MDLQGFPRNTLRMMEETNAGFGTIQTAVFRVIQESFRPEDLILRVRVSAINSGSPLFNGRIDDSFEATANFQTWVSSPTRTVVGEDLVLATRSPKPFIRVQGSNFGTSPNVDYEIDLTGLELIELV